MVSVNKMVQSGNRVIQLIFFCLFWELGTYGFGEPEYSRVRIHQEDRGEILLFLVNVSLHMIGKKLDQGYKCPVYCGVDHKHYYWENNEDKKGNIQAANGLYRAVRASSQE